MFSLDQLSQWIVAGAGMLILAVCSFGVSYIRGVGKCLTRLDKTMDKLLEREAFHKKDHERIEGDMKEHDERLHILELGSSRR